MYVLTVEALLVVLTAGAIWLWPVTSRDVVTALMIWGCAVVYIEATRRIERSRTARTPHVDLNSIWTFSAALLVHPALVAAIVSANYVHRWLRVRHTIVHRHTFNVAANTLAGYAAVGVLTAAHQHPALTTSAPLTATTYLVVLAAGIADMAVSALLVTGAIVLSTPRLSFVRVATDPDDNAIDVAGIGLGVLLAWTLVAWPVAVTIVFGVAVVLHGKVLVPQFRRAARTDPKTGLLNLPAWTSAARGQVGRAGRAGLLMIDLDHFKLVNDVYGHLLGDEVLMAVAMAITEVVRGGDVVGRFGGEEFVVLLRGADEDVTVAVAERIRQRVRGLPVATDNDAVRVTCSVGAAVYPLHGNDLDQLLKAADNALHTAKKCGRNQVRVSHPPAT